MANFRMKKGTMTESKQTFENILYNTLLDTAHEKLYLARLYESLARSYSNDDEKDKYESMKYNFFKEYPQLIPFSGFTITLNLTTSPLNTSMEKNIIKELKGCNINWTDEPGNTHTEGFYKFFFS